MLETLLLPETYGLKDEKVELIQTAISWVFLAGQYVYKVKKPVDFGFLDFTTLENRKHFCYREVELNKRLCPDLYLGVVNITQSGDRIAIDKPGAIIDYAVKMKRLPKDAQMSELLKRGEVSKETVEKIASTLSEFHSNAEVIEDSGYDTVKFNWDENFEQTERFVGEIIEQPKYEFMCSQVKRFLDKNKSFIENRIVKDGHGDLHSRNIFVTDKIHIFDCIEFNKRFRYGDVASEVAFLAMDLDFYGREDLSKRFVNQYIKLSNDGELPRLLSFYKCYRAYVRAKINCFQHEQGVDGSKELASKYFNLAHTYSKSLCSGAI